MHLDGAEKGDLSKIGSIKASATSKTKSMWKKVKGWFVSKKGVSEGASILWLFTPHGSPLFHLLC